MSPVVPTVRSPAWRKCSSPPTSATSSTRRALWPRPRALRTPSRRRCEPLAKSGVRLAFATSPRPSGFSARWSRSWIEPRPRAARPAASASLLRRHGHAFAQHLGYRLIEDGDAAVDLLGAHRKRRRDAPDRGHRPHAHDVHGEAELHAAGGDGAPGRGVGGAGLAILHELHPLQEPEAPNIADDLVP